MAKHLAASNLTELPTLPVVVVRLQELVYMPSVSMAKVGSVLEKDQALTLRVLKLVNSSYYQIPGGVSDVTKALKYLGFTTLSQIVLSISVFGMFESLGPISLKKFWEHSIAVAAGAKWLATRASAPSLVIEQAFTAGLLHDVGKLALHRLDPKMSAQIIDEAQAKQCDYSEIEKQFEFSHSEMGESVLAQWGLPKALAHAVGGHHALTPVKSDKASPGIFVTLADRCARALKIGESGSFGAVEPDFLKKLLGADLPVLEAKINDEVLKMGAILNGSAS